MVAFFGTPHAGSDFEKLAKAVTNIVRIVKKPNKKLLGVLRRNSEILANIKDEFLTMVARRQDRQNSLRPIELHAFIEEQLVDFLKRVRQSHTSMMNNMLTFGSTSWNLIRRKYPDKP